MTNYTKAGGGCAACHEGIEEILAKVRWPSCTAPTGEELAAGRLPGDAGSPKLDQLSRAHPQDRGSRSKPIRPMLQRDHGDVELVEVDGKNIYVNLKGACAGCMMEAATLGGIQQQAGRGAGRIRAGAAASPCRRSLNA